MDSDDKSVDEKPGWCECEHEIETAGTKTPREMIDNGNKANSRPAFHTALTCSFNNDVTPSPCPPLC